MSAAKAYKRAEMHDSPGESLPCRRSPTAGQLLGVLKYDAPAHMA